MGSPRRFANQGLVYLSEIKTKEEIQDLSVKQAKDILAMNRVNFKGVVEKDELLKHVLRLWKQDHKAQEGTLCAQCGNFKIFLALRFYVEWNHGVITEVTEMSLPQKLLYVPYLDL